MRRAWRRTQLASRCMASNSRPSARSKAHHVTHVSHQCPGCIYSVGPSQSNQYRDAPTYTVFRHQGREDCHTQLSFSCLDSRLSVFKDLGKPCMENLLSHLDVKVEVIPDECAYPTPLESLQRGELIRTPWSMLHGTKDRRIDDMSQTCHYCMLFFIGHHAVRLLSRA